MSDQASRYILHDNNTWSIFVADNQTQATLATLAIFVTLVTTTTLVAAATTTCTTRLLATLTAIVDIHSGTVSVETCSLEKLSVLARYEYHLNPNVKRGTN